MFAAFHDAEHCSSRVFKRKNQLFKTCLRSHRNVYPTVLFNVKTKRNEPLHYQQFIDLPRNGFVAHLKFSSNHGRGCLKVYSKFSKIGSFPVSCQQKKITIIMVVVCFCSSTILMFEL